ncbi:hypothetical protein C2W62_09595 [Candidatus Entotheonella serta]|nr:hypothetical protein C2W62_09595 [Candidatus Entotheonella serta]
MERLQQLGLRASQQDEVYRLQELVDDFDFMTAAEHVANMQVNLTKRGRPKYYCPSLHDGRKGRTHV